MIAAGTIPADIVYSDAQVVAFRDINPQAPTHVLVVPKRHVVNAAELALVAPAELADVLALAGRAALADGHEDYRLVFNTGFEAGQRVFHAHLHVLAGRPLAWPPG